MMKYNKKHQERINNSGMIPSEGFNFGYQELGRTTIDISGVVCKAFIIRNKEGNIEIQINEPGVFEVGGWLENGTTTEGYSDEVIIGQFNP